MSLRDAAVLIDAALEGNITAVREALEEGADINARDIVGGTALRHASLKGHTETVSMLKTYGAL